MVDYRRKRVDKVSDGQGKKNEDKELLSHG